MASMGGLLESSSMLASQRRSLALMHLPRCAASRVTKGAIERSPSLYCRIVNTPSQVRVTSRERWLEIEPLLFENETAPERELDDCRAPAASRRSRLPDRESPVCETAPGISDGGRGASSHPSTLARRLKFEEHTS